MTETDLQREIQTQCTSIGTRLWRMQSGNFELKDGRRITVGFPGISDLIGCQSVIVTEEMIGQRLAILAAIEVKVKGGRTDAKRLADQAAFLDAIKRLGGRAGFATSVAEAAAILCPPTRSRSS